MYWIRRREVWDDSQRQTAADRWMVRIFSWFLFSILVSSVVAMGIWGYCLLPLNFHLSEDFYNIYKTWGDKTCVVSVKRNARKVHEAMDDWVSLRHAAWCMLQCKKSTPNKFFFWLHTKNFTMRYKKVPPYFFVTLHIWRKYGDCPYFWPKYSQFHWHSASPWNS